jgi:hypothetical protein
VTPLDHPERAPQADLVRWEYIRQLVRAHPSFEDQLADIYRVLTTLSEDDRLRAFSPLDSARAAYVACLQERHVTAHQHVADVAAICACVFLQDVACLTPGRSTSHRSPINGALCALDRGVLSGRIVVSWRWAWLSR